MPQENRIREQGYGSFSNIFDLSFKEQRGAKTQGPSFTAIDDAKATIDDLEWTLDGSFIRYR